MGKYKPNADLMNYEGMEFLWSYSKTKEMAFKAMVQCMKDEHDERLIDINNIEQDRVYYCKQCQFSTQGENICCECGEIINAVGRKVFVYYLVR